MMFSFRQQDRQPEPHWKKKSNSGQEVNRQDTTHGAVAMHGAVAGAEGRPAVQERGPGTAESRDMPASACPGHLTH